MEYLAFAALGLLVWWSWRSSRKTIGEIRAVEERLEAEGFERTFVPIGDPGDSWRHPHRWRPRDRTSDPGHADRRESRRANWVLVGLLALCGAFAVSVVVVALLV